MRLSLLLLLCAGTGLVSSSVFLVLSMASAYALEGEYNSLPLPLPLFLR